MILACVAASGGCTSDTPLVYRIHADYSVHDPEFTQVMGNLLGPPLVPGNSIKTLLNGDEIFPAMLGAIHSAQKTITLETFIYWSGTVGQSFTDALSERAQHGVKVHVMLDGPWQFEDGPE